MTIYALRDVGVIYLAPLLFWMVIQASIGG